MKPFTEMSTDQEEGSIHQGEKISFIDLVQEMDIFIAFFVSVDDEIEVIAGSRHHRDELFSFSGRASHIVHQRQVAVRCQGQAAGRTLSGKHLQKQRQVFLRDINARASALVLFNDPQILLIDIARLFRDDDLYPVAFVLDHFHLFARKQLIQNFIIHTAAGTDIQPAAVGSDDTDLSCFLSIFFIIEGEDNGSILGADMNRAAFCLFGILRGYYRIVVFLFIRIGIFRRNRDGILHGRFAVFPGISKSRNAERSGTDHNRQQGGQDTLNSHGLFPPHLPWYNSYFRDSHRP